MSKYYKPNNSTILYLNSSYNCVNSSSITITKATGGSGYTSAPSIVVVPAAGDLGLNASATATYSAGAVTAITMVNNGSGYNLLPTIKTVGGGNPGTITGYTALTGGSGYILPPTITATGGGGSGFSAVAVIGNVGISSTFTITAGGSNYVVGDKVVFTGGGGGSGAIATVSTIGANGLITGISLTSTGGGYTTAPTISIISTLGTGANISCAILPAAVTDITIINGGSGYTSSPSFVFTPVNGGTGASATPIVNAGVPATFTVAFTRTYTYTWNVPDITINDLAKLSAINIIATGFTATTPYTYRILGLQYNSRDSFFSDYGAPILSMAQNTNVCSYGSLGGNSFCIILTPQTIRQIQISVDDDISTRNSGQAAAINFVIALEIEEYDPVLTQIGDPFAESASKIKPF